MNDQEVPIGYVQTSEARKLLHISASSLRIWGDEGKIECIRKGGKGTHRYYNVKSFLENKGAIKREPEKTRRKVCYCRVSTRNQTNDLERQEQYLRTRYPTHEFIKDIGSGLNFKRKGLKTILDYAHNGELEELVVAHKDRLCRFGFDLIEYFVTEFSKGKIIILNDRKSSKNEEFVEDILSIITVFSARINGLRKYKTSIQSELLPKNDENKNHSDAGTEKHVESVVRSV